MKVYELNSDGKPTDRIVTIGYKLRNVDSFEQNFYEKGYDTSTNLAKYDFEAKTTYPWWVAFIPYLVLIAAACVLWFIMINRSTGGAGKISSFGKAKVKMPQTNKNKVMFKDVAGADEEKEELEEIVEFLKDPAKFTKLGAKIPHGVLLIGPPGTGKTLLAKAVAGEAGVPFLSISGSDFVEMYVGVGASRVRDLFETARKSPASIVFIDEIDAVGRHRGAGLGGGHDEREQTLNQLLVEMDGFGSHEGIIVIAATNRPDILDPAFLRPGRFDRQITVNYPDIKGREEILKVHARNKPFEADVDFAKVAKTTVGFTGADLANLLNEAALLASRRGKALIGMDEISDAFIKVIAGPQKKSRVMKEREKKNTAYHEAGHAIVAWALPSQDPVQQISIIPSGRALGYTLNPPVEDKYSVYREELKEQISMLLGGRAAEEIIFGDISGGASNDIERATKIAKSMVTRLGMSGVLGPRSFGSDHDEIFLGRDFSSSADYSRKSPRKSTRKFIRLSNPRTSAPSRFSEKTSTSYTLSVNSCSNTKSWTASSLAAMEEAPPSRSLRRCRRPSAAVAARKTNAAGARKKGRLPRKCAKPKAKTQTKNLPAKTNLTTTTTNYKQFTQSQTLVCDCIFFVPLYLPDIVG